jgi:hypothetical protein
MRRARVRLRAIVSLSVVLALCLSLAGIQPAYAGDVTVQNALDTSLTIYNNSFEGWLSAAAHDGVDMAQNIPIGDNGTAFFYIEVAGPGTLSWWSHTSTESGFDKLRLYDNGVLQPSYDRSGEAGWAPFSYSVPAGAHQIRFAYEKDFIWVGGSDSVYIDELSYAGMPPTGRVDGAHLAGNAVPLVSASPEAEARTGFSVGISDNVAAIASNWDDTTQTNAGSVTLYRRVNGEWVSDQLITAPDETASSYLGTDMALDSGLLACASATGKIYVYTDNGSDFAPYGATITAPAGASDFGGSIAVSSGTIVTGARYAGDDFQGRVYVYTYDGGAWTLQQAIDAPDAGSRDFFGTSVDIEGDTLIIGSPGHDHAGAPGGAAYIYTRSGGEWTLATELNHEGGTASTDDGFSDFGWSVGVSNGTAVAGARTRHALYVYTRPDGVWALTDILRRPTEPAGSSDYGTHVAIDGDTILSGDPFYELSAHGGAVFAYQRSNSYFFDHVETLYSGVPATFGGYGGWVAIDGAQFVVGESYWDGPAGSNQGRAVVYDGAYYRVPAGATFGVDAARGVCANDIDPNGDVVSVYTFEQPTSGTIDYIAPQGSFGYTAADPSPAEVVWGYTPRDPGGLLGDVTTAYITVAPKPTGTPLINNGSHGSPVQDIAVDLTPLGNVRMFRTRIGSGAWGPWPRIATATTVQLPATAGTYAVQVEVSGSGGTVVHSWDVTYPATYARFPGSDRYNTAIMAAQSAYPTGSCTSVIIATGNNYPDALAAAGLGGAANAPVLLVNPAKARSDVIAEIKRLTQGKSSFKLYIMGGTAAVPVSTESWLKSSLTGESVERFAGTDRYHTARLVAARMKTLLGASFGETALLVPGLDFTDGLIVGPAAYAAKAPILLTRPQSDWELAGTLQQLGTTRLVLCGSTAALPAAGETYLKGAVPGLATVRATQSGDPYVRSAEAAEYFATPANGFGLSWSGVGIATAERYPDGLAAGCIDGKAATPLLLTKVASLPATISAKLTAHKGMIATVRFYGGTMAVSAATETAVRNALK